MRYITLTLKRKGIADSVKQLAFAAHETVSDVIREAREYWSLPAHADLRLCKETGFPYEPWTKVGELTARPQISLVLVVR